MASNYDNKDPTVVSDVIEALTLHILNLAQTIGRNDVVSAYEEAMRSLRGQPRRATKTGA